MELLNQLTIPRADSRYVKRSFTISFGFGDFAGGSKSIGVVPGNIIISKLVLRVISPFNNGSEITVGDDIAQGRLMVIADNFPDNVGRYSAEPDYLYSSDTEIKMYFPNGTPDQGSGEVIVNFA
jgi:hypothetical protein